MPLKIITFLIKYLEVCRIFFFYYVVVVIINISIIYIYYSLKTIIFLYVIKNSSSKVYQNKTLKH